MAIFSSRSVAVIGASGNPQKLGYTVVKNLITYKYHGAIYPINLKGEDILGLRSYTAIEQVSEKIDIAVIAIPAPLVADMLRSCIKKLIPLVIIISAGFKETGEAGMVMENELKEIIKDSQTRIIGPNCLGIIDSQVPLNASFAASFPSYDPISFISQSGALGTAFLDWTSENNLGIQNFISIGNKADIDENFLLEHLEGEKVIACYLEDIKDGKRLMEIGYSKNKKRPVLVLKPGKSDAAIKAISSHTGSLAGGHNAIGTALKQSGYLEVETIGELFNKMKAFAWQPLPKNNAIAIVTNAGGPAVITTDLITAQGMSLAPITLKTETTLMQVLPRTSNFHNPIDVIGDALSDRYKAAMEAVLREDEVSALLVLLTPQIMTEIEKTAYIIGLMQQYKKPIIASFIGGKLIEKGLTLLAKEHIPAYRFPEDAVQVLASMVQYSDYCKKEVPLTGYVKSKYYAQNHLHLYELYYTARKNGLTAFPPKDAEEIATAYGLHVPRSYTCANEDEAASLANQSVHFPCALKISSPNLLHKSDIGGVRVNIKNEDELRRIYKELDDIATSHTIHESSIELQEYIDTGIFLIVGASRDPNFGIILIFGEGGIYTEIREDIARRVAPITDEEIRTMIYETKISKILNGARGQQPYDILPVVNAIKSIIALMEEYEFIQSIDINPLILERDAAYAVDIKILI